MNLKELLSNIEFDYKIIKDEEGKNAIQLIDETGVNLGQIEDDIFYNVADIIDRTGQYWKDYVIDDATNRLGLGENSTWEDVYKVSVLKDDIETNVLGSLVHPETVEIEGFARENSMNHDETLIFEDLQALSNEENSGLPEFNRVKIYNPRDYDILPDGDKIHVLAEYSGEEDEDAVFNQLNDKDFPSEFNGVEINWTPISTKQSGTIEQYLEHLVKVQEAFEKEKESYNISDIIKETVEETVKNTFGKEITNEQILIEIYNKNESAIHPNAFQELPNQVANDILYAINSDDKKLFEKDGKFAIRANDENPKDDVLLSPLELLKKVENRMEHWYEEKQLSEDEAARLGRLHWFENGMRFPDEERVNGFFTSYTQCFDLLKSHFPEITKEESELIFNAMENQDYIVYAGKYGVFVEDYTDMEGMELNLVDLPTLAEYALGDTSLSKGQQNILSNLIPNLNNRGQNMKNNALDTIDTERMDELAKKAYRKYQYEWLSEHGISLDDLADEMDAALENYMEETNGERIDAGEQIREVIDNGINGEMFASLDEFKTNEFLDPKSVELGHLLEGHEKDEYLSHIQSYAKSLGVEIDDPMKELEPVTVTKESALDFFTKLSKEKKANISASLESINAVPLDVYTHGDESYLVSKTFNGTGTFTSHLITESGLEWGHYDIPTKWQAQKQTMQRAAGTSFDNIDLVEVEPIQRHLAEVIWDREDIKFAIANNPELKTDEELVTDKQVDNVLEHLNIGSLEDAMVETGWSYIDQAVSETIEMSKEQEHRLDNVYVADKDRKVALKFKPDIQFNEETGEFDMPHISITMENTITGARFTDSNFKENVSKDVFLKTPFIDKFVERTAEKYGITKDKIEYISKEDFEAIAQDRKSIKPLKEQKPLERWMRMTQDVMFRKGIENNSENTDKILSIAKGILKSFSDAEKEQCKLNLSLDSKYKSEKEALAHALGSGYTHDLSENMKRNQVRAKKRDDEGISR